MTIFRWVHRAQGTQIRPVRSDPPRRPKIGYPCRLATVPVPQTAPSWHDAEFWWPGLGPVKPNVRNCVAGGGPEEGDGPVPGPLPVRDLVRGIGPEGPPDVGLAHRSVSDVPDVNTTRPSVAP